MPVTRPVLVHARPRPDGRAREGGLGLIGWRAPRRGLGQRGIHIQRCSIESPDKERRHLERTREIPETTDILRGGVERDALDLGQRMGPLPQTWVLGWGDDLASLPARSCGRACRFSDRALAVRCLTASLMTWYRPRNFCLFHLCLQ